MALDHRRVLRLAEDLEEVVVADEVEPRERGPLLLEEVAERLLAPVELVEHGLERPADVAVDVRVHEAKELRVRLDVAHDVAEVLVDALEALGLVGEAAAAEDGLEVDPLALDPVERVEDEVEVRHLGLVRRACAGGGGRAPRGGGGRSTRTGPLVPKRAAAGGRERRRDGRFQLRSDVKRNN